MITPVTRPSEYFLVWSRDPGLDLPDVPPDEKHPDHERLRDERRKLLRVARESGKWDDIVKPGEQVTLFKFRHLDRDQLWEWDQYRDRHGNDKSATMKGWSLLFRAALLDIRNFGDFKMPKKVKDPETGLVVAPITVLEAFPLDLVDLMVLEFGMAIVDREHATVPKS